MVDVGKREDRLLDWAHEKQIRIDAVLEQIDEWEQKALTVQQIEIIGVVKGLLTF